MPLGSARKSVCLFGDVCCVYGWGSVGKGIYTECIWCPPTLGCFKGLKTQVLLPCFLLGRKCSHGIALSPKPHKLRSQSFSSNVFKIYPISSLQGVFRNTIRMVVFTISCLLQYLTLHNSSTPENWGLNFYKLNLILIAVILLQSVLLIS